ncbi:MAG: hypothetical protein ABR548_03055 [Actinomycetota bacterium]|nr:hypothetical protein [Actinomycetota bacterium]
MGPMLLKAPLNKKRVTRRSLILISGLFVWSLIAAPQAVPDEPKIEEPPTLSAYDATADAAPISGLIDHQLRLVAAAPGIAHSTSEVSYPSEATSTTWLVDGGVLNGAHGTTTGTRVPTEASASQPGGIGSEEFSIGSDTVGNDSTLRYGVGVARASAVSSDRPRGLGNAHLANIVLLPAPGSPNEAPGTYDPQGDASHEKEHPPSPGADDPRAFTPNPAGQMGLLTIGSVTSASDTFREAGTVVSIAVAEINGINIGNRTADNRCTNCFTIDQIRVEARAESDGTSTGALARTRILVHRACRVAIANDAQTGDAYEAVKCLDPNPDGVIAVVSGKEDPETLEDQEDPNARGVREVESIEVLNKMFHDGLGMTGDMGFQIHFGTQFGSTIEDKGEVADAFAQGLAFQVRTVVAAKQAGDIADANKDSIKSADQQCDEAQGKVQDQEPPQLAAQTSSVTVPCPSGVAETARAVRTVDLMIGSVHATASARPALGGVVPGDETGGGTFTPGIEIPTVNIPSFNIPQGGGTNQYIVGGGGIGAGRLKLVVDWSSVSVKPWAPKDMAKAIFSGALLLGLVMLVRRRLMPHL